MLVQRLGRALAIGVIAQVGTRRGDDCELRRHLAVAKPVVERGQQFAQRQIAGGAEHHAVEGRDGNDLRHGSAPIPRVRPGGEHLRCRRQTTGEAPPSMLIAAPVVKPA